MATINTAFQKASKAILELETCKETDDTVATAAAKELSQIAVAHREKICQSDQEQQLKKVLKATAIPFPIAYQSIKLLKSPALQFNDNLIRELSKTVCLFLEHVACQCVRQKRRPYASTAIELHSTFKEIIKALPQKEIETRFNLKCCRAAVKNLTYKDDIKKAVTSNSVPIGVGVISFIFSCNASPPYINPATVIPSSAQLVQDMYRSLPELWYREVLALKWSSIELKIRKRIHYEKKTASGKSIRETLKKAKENHKIAYYICQICKIIIENKDAEDTLKKELLIGKDVSIVRLAQYRPPKIIDKHQDVRCLALGYLEDLYLDTEHKNEICRTVIKQATKGSERTRVRRKALSVWQQLKTHDENAFRQTVVDMLSITNKHLGQAVQDGRTLEDLQQKQREIADRIKKLESPKQQSGSLSQHSGSNTEVDAKLAKALKEQDELSRLQDLVHQQTLLTKIGTEDALNAIQEELGYEYDD